ncbi:hypothetical protein VTK73DRAFT_9190 [Phialemonium thermophilum]|uniref:Fungal-type protein kinase domain-containing protein n=1 Tax=Phialemonium thermophilum TaxID=223376 RepID=A0ABR3W483_9PEZI
MEAPSPTSTTDEQHVLRNMDGRLHGPMSGFFDKYFGSFRYVHRDGLLEIQAAGPVIARCAIPSAPSSPDDFLPWFFELVRGQRDGARGSWHVSGGPSASCCSIDDEGACLVLTVPPCPDPEADTRWDRVQVVGQFYADDVVCYQDGLLRLCKSARRVFASQPTRFFLHGFSIRGPLIELWVFDRSGLYCSDLFDVQDDFVRFASIVLSYQHMSDPALGSSSIIGTDENGSYVALESAEGPPLGRLYLERQPIACRDNLVGAGTTCYRARASGSDQWDYVLKFKWRWARDRPEDELLRLTREKGVWGAVSLDYYEEIETTANLRRGLRWGPQRRFRAAGSRARDGGGAECRRHGATGNAGGLANYTEETDNFFQNRILACVVTSPVGRPLHTFRSVLELLQVFRDAVKCHRSLFRDAQILHQDVSAGNIIILDAEEEGSPRGILIDLDSAIEVTDGSETEPDITGTRPFMAIGVLRSEPHTCRHDLESFLYVFLWTIITNHAEDPPETSRLREWSNGDWDELARRKSLDMDPGGFQTILDEIPVGFDSLRPVAANLRGLLFSSRAGPIWKGTHGSPGDVDTLYDGMISVFEEAIAFEDKRSAGMNDRLAC